jgi:hypothetical protein
MMHTVSTNIGLSMVGAAGSMTVLTRYSSHTLLENVPSSDCIVSPIFVETVCIIARIEDAMYRVNTVMDPAAPTIDRQRPTRGRWELPGKGQTPDWISYFLAFRCFLTDFSTVIVSLGVVSTSI